jgi:hypothetical protein
VAGHSFALDPWYVTGLVEAEGSFTFSRRSGGMTLYFAVKLTGRDGELLGSLQAFFGGVGTLYSLPARPASATTSAANPATYYRVCRRDELREIVRHFDAYPLKGAKTASFAIWRLMVLLKLDFPRTSSKQREQLAAQLSAASPRYRRAPAGS